MALILLGECKFHHISIVPITVYPLNLLINVKNIFDLIFCAKVEFSKNFCMSAIFVILKLNGLY